MIDLTIENYEGIYLTLTGDEQKYVVTDIDGITGLQADIHTSDVYGVAGNKYHSSKVEARSITITVLIRGEIEDNRKALYRIFPAGSKLTLHFNSNKKISGYVEHLECKIYSKKEQAVISIVCPYPYYESEYFEETNQITAESLFTFPFTLDSTGSVISSQESNFTVVNSGEVQSGVILKITVTTPFSQLFITNTRNNQQIGIEMSSLITGDVITINTQKGSKSILKNGTRMMSALINGSQWIQMEIGKNPLTFSKECSVVATFTNYYEGI